MSKEERKVPELRFKGFHDDWEQRELEELIESFDEIIEGPSNFPIVTSSRNGLYLQNEYFNGKRTGIDKTLKFHRVPMNYVTYRHMSDDSIFKFNQNTFDTDVLVSKEYPVFKANDKSNQEFLVFHLNNTQSFLKFSTMQKLGGTRVRLYYKNLIKYKLKIPQLNEQNKIAGLVNNLEKTIVLHQRKINTLKALKKVYLNIMFTNKNDNTPLLRFNNFNEEWEQRKLESITKKIGSGKTPKGGSSVYLDSGIPFLRSQNIKDNSVSFNEIVYIDENTNNEMINSLVLSNDVLLNITGASIGRSAVYKNSEPANVNQHVCIIRPIQTVNSYFIQLNLSSENGQKQIDNNQAGGGREGLNFKQIGKMSFHYPILNEQIKVGELFNYLDKSIILHHYKLYTLERLKQTYLNKMFI